MIEDDSVNELTAHYSCGYRDGHSDGFKFGFEAGTKATHDILAEFEKQLIDLVAQKTTNNVDRVRQELQENGSFNAPVFNKIPEVETITEFPKEMPERKPQNVRIPRGLSTGQAGAYTFVANNPGCTSREFRNAGFPSDGILYSLIRMGIVYTEKEGGKINHFYIAKSPDGQPLEAHAND